MKNYVWTRVLAVAGAALTLSLAAPAHAAQVELTLSPGASGCVDASGTAWSTQVNAFGFVHDTSLQATFRLRNVTKAQLIAGPVVQQQATFNVPANAPTDLYRLCANNNVAGQTIKVTLINNVF